MDSDWGALRLVIPAAIAVTTSIMLTSVEVWEGGIALHTANSGNELRFGEPYEPEIVAFVATDDRGTEYRTIGTGRRQIGGGLSRGMQEMIPGPPSEATTLTLQGPRTFRVALGLDGR